MNKDSFHLLTSSFWGDEVWRKVPHKALAHFLFSE
jgi:hypothetical protein